MIRETILKVVERHAISVSFLAMLPTASTFNKDGVMSGELCTATGSLTLPFELERLRNVQEQFSIWYLRRHHTYEE